MAYAAAFQLVGGHVSFRRVSAFALILSLLAALAAVPATARTQEEIDEDVGKAEERLAEAQLAIDTFEILLERGEFVFIRSDSGLIAWDPGDAIALTNEIGTLFAGEDQIDLSELALNALASGDIRDVLASIYGSLDGSRQPNAEVPDGMDVAAFFNMALREIEATVDDLDAERARLRAPFDAVLQEIEWLEQERQGAHGFPPGWIDGRPASLAAGRLGDFADWAVDDRDAQRSLNVLHGTTATTSPFSVPSESCYTLEDGLHWCGLGGAWQSVYQTVPGGFRRYDIATATLCDLVINDISSDAGDDGAYADRGGSFSGFYSCALDDRFWVGIWNEDLLGDPVLITLKLGVDPVGPRYDEG